MYASKLNPPAVASKWRCCSWCGQVKPRAGFVTARHSVQPKCATCAPLDGPRFAAPAEDPPGHTFVKLVRRVIALS